MTITSDSVVLEDFAVRDTRGDGVRVTIPGVDG
jgi:hypothetical protein